jgi:hypothetical protein
MSRNLFTQHRLEHNYEKGLDFFPTPGWATRALAKYLITLKPDTTILEPAAGARHMSKVLEEYSQHVTATDIAERNFLTNPPKELYDWVITNPPFARAQAFVLQALPIATIGVAMLVRINFLASAERTYNLFQPYPPSIIGVFSERIGFKYGEAKPNVPTATDFCWIVWLKNKPQGPSVLTWIPRCKSQLSQKQDWY